MTDPIMTVLAIVGILVLLVIAFWAGRAVERWNSPLAEEARLTRLALESVARLKELRNPAKTPDTVAAEAKEAKAIEDLKSLTASVT